MSNLYKGQAIVPADYSTRVIDSNELLQEKIDDFHAKLRARQRAQESNGEEALGEEIQFQDGIGEGILPTETVIEPVEPEVDYVAQAKEEAEQILADANRQAQGIVDDASSQAEALKSQATESGRQEGYQTGTAQAVAELNQEKDKLEEMRQQIQKEFEQKELSMEKDLVDVISQVFEKVFQIQFSDKKEIVLHLVENAITNIEGSREYQVKVNDDNFEFIQSNKSVIEERVGADVKVDIISDPLLGKNECIIETDGGVFDCSLGVQLENLIKDLKSLSL